MVEILSYQLVLKIPITPAWDVARRWYASCPGNVRLVRPRRVNTVLVMRIICAAQTNEEGSQLQRRRPLT